MTEAASGQVVTGAAPGGVITREGAGPVVAALPYVITY
jgi:hypothetical protein